MWSMVLLIFITAFRFPYLSLFDYNAGWMLRETYGRVLFTASGIAGIVRVLAQSAGTTSGVANCPCSFLSSGVVKIWIK